MQVVIDLEKQHKNITLYCKEQEPGLCLRVLSLFCWKFAFSWKYIDVIRKKRENSDLINSCSAVAFIMKRK